MNEKVEKSHTVSATKGDEDPGVAGLRKIQLGVKFFT